MKKIFAKNSSQRIENNLDDDDFIVYHNVKSTKNKAPYIIFSHGLMSDKNSSKALAIEEYCVEKDLNYIRYDNFGSGESSGDFPDQNMSSWLAGLKMVIDQLTTGEVILVGSSKGGWLTLLAALNYPDRIKAIVVISAAVDFTEEAIWEKLPPNQQQEMREKGVTEMAGEGDGCDYVVPISYQLIQDGRKHLLLRKDEIAIDCPVHLIHGMQDIDVPHSYSMRAAEKIRSSHVITKLVKDGDHRLSRPEDIRIITNSIEEVMAL